jgi:hypothetical protein
MIINDLTKLPTPMIIDDLTKLPTPMIIDDLTKLPTPMIIDDLTKLCIPSSQLDRSDVLVGSSRQCQRWMAPHMHCANLTVILCLYVCDFVCFLTVMPHDDMSLGFQ